MRSVEYFGVRDVGRTGEQSLFMHEIMGDYVKLALAIRDSADHHFFLLDSCLPHKYFQLAVSKMRPTFD